MSTNTVTIAAKVPTTLAARLEELARRRRLTVSLLLRGLVERELNVDVDAEFGPVEATTRARIGLLIEDTELDPRASMAAELARRLDVDPSNGAQHTRTLMLLLDDLDAAASARNPVPTPLDEIRARRILRLAGYGVTKPDGEVLCLPQLRDDWLRRYVEPGRHPVTGDEDWR